MKKNIPRAISQGQISKMNWFNLQQFFGRVHHGVVSLDQILALKNHLYDTLRRVNLPWIRLFLFQHLLGIQGDLGRKDINGCHVREVENDENPNIGT